MAKWADYIVTAVRFNTHGTHIEWLRCCKDNGDNLGSDQTFSRQQVIDAINKGTTFITAIKGADGRYYPGQSLFAYVMRSHFLKTREDTSTKDNLDNMPRF